MSEGHRHHLSPLESRILYCGGGGHEDEAGQVLGSPVPAEAAALPPPTPGAAVAGIPVGGAVPALQSRPGATAKLYLDFDGDGPSSWGSYSVSPTPAYDTDGDPSTFTDGELANIRSIWARVAEKYAPFNVDVTTVKPASLADRITLRVVVGGDGKWAGGVYGGLAYVGGFSGSAPNTVYSFSVNLGHGNPRYVAESIAHESGHGFGLSHQSAYTGSTKTAEYSGGNSSAAPIMGDAFSASRGLWWNGPTTSVSSIQDDLAVISGVNNAFGYRADDHGGIAAPSNFAFNGSQLIASGVIERMTDADAFSLASNGGAVSFTASPAADGGMLDLKLEIWMGGQLLIAADTAAFGETITTTLGAGHYTVMVSSHGGYGDVGQYTLAGTAPTPTYAPAPTGLTGTALASYGVRLTWADVAGETGYRVERSRDGLVGWEMLSIAAADVTEFSDVTVSADRTYYYRVSSLSAAGPSTPTESVRVRTEPEPMAPPPEERPDRPTPLIVDRGRIRLTWPASALAETGYKIQRRAEGGEWETVENVPAVKTSWMDDDVRVGVTYRYRIAARRPEGRTAFSDGALARPAADVRTRTWYLRSIFSDEPIAAGVL